jgi:UDP-3-O-[3-hydroxymyristoyl] glucosamine N-acyltransferase
VTIREECVLGNRIILQPGVVIGGDGFGFAPKKDGTYQKIPQRGIVVIEDDVEIQANSCVDRATMGETRIRRGTKLDNMVQIAHNVVIGEDTVIAAQTGVSGSTKVGNHVMIAGNVGIVGHLSIADRVIIAGQSGVSKSITKEGETVFGYPAKEIGKARRMEGALRQLPELLTQVRQMEQEIQKLKAAMEQSKKEE